MATGLVLVAAGFILVVLLLMSLPLESLSIATLQRIFDSLGDVVFCVKNLDLQYIAVNQAFADRAGARSKQSMLGQTAADFFAPELAAVYQRQDLQLFRTGKPVVDQLEQITNVDGSVGWYLANKYPITNAAGNVSGLVGVSQDLHTPSDSDLALANLERVVHTIKTQLDRPLRVEQLAELAGLSSEQLDRRMKRVFRLSTKKFIMKCRLEHSAELLADSRISLAEVADRCGFADQSALTRQFRSTFLTTPAAYRNALLKNQDS